MTPDYARCPKRTSRCPTPGYCQPTCLHAFDWLTAQGAYVEPAHPREPRYSVKRVSAEMLPHAVDLLQALMGPDRALLGPEVGDSYAETVAGHLLLAKRQIAGGIDVREVVGK